MSLISSFRKTIDPLKYVQRTESQKNGYMKKQLLYTVIVTISIDCMCLLMLAVLFMITCNFKVH